MAGQPPRLRGHPYRWREHALRSTPYFIPSADFFEWTKSLVYGGRDLRHIFLPGP